MVYPQSLPNFCSFSRSFLGRQLLRNSVDIEEILRTLIIAGLLYSLPMLFEIRMSPQLHQLALWIQFFRICYRDALRWISAKCIYGERAGRGVFYDDGYRGSSRLLADANTGAGNCLLRAITAYLSAILVLCKSLGALVYGVVWCLWSV